jgi:hypothetical protein
VNFEVLHVADCPNRVVAAARLREALDATELREVTVTHRLLVTAEEAARVPFAGSPTILLDGEDLFPGGDTTKDLACRVYPTPSGLAGSPTTAQLVAAITAHTR